MEDKNIKTYDVIVMGGGASGMMSAIVASERGANVLILEKNKRLGEKLRITGGGRCNILNAEYNLRTLLKNFGDAEQYLYSAFSKFGVQESVDFFEDLKVPITIQAKNRAFPLSEKAVDVVHAMINRLDKNAVEIIKNSPVSKINIDENKIVSLNCGDKTYKASQYILAVGGSSRPETGSSGDGFGWLRELGHTVKTPSPNITPLGVNEKWVKTVSGVVLKSINISFFVDSKRRLKLNGDVLFTHFGISGPLILNNAHKVADLLQEGVVVAQIDCYPELTEKELDIKIVDILNQNGAKLLKNVLNNFTPAGLGPVLKELLSHQVDFDTKTSEVNKQTRALLVNNLKHLSLTIEKLMGFERAVVADGGVDLKEIDTRTMRSYKIDNLYITGDLLDINRPSGGFSLQLCWTTGYLAGTCAVDALKSKK
ncbi:aminoacetone oxidase family FAD-binding enzyme [Candidatus Saccharibacteria bacterium]|nr:aminoacetone oxidase family FAD-binding enzyme [Candidatus Saccharibacteria bacterium]